MAPNSNTTPPPRQADGPRFRQTRADCEAGITIELGVMKVEVRGYIISLLISAVGVVLFSSYSTWLHCTGYICMGFKGRTAQMYMY